MFHDENPTAIENLMAYEDGGLDYDDVVKLFQGLVDTGLAWKLQGSYGRMAHRLLKAGVVHWPEGSGA